MSIFAILALVPLISTCAWCCGRHADQDEAEFIRNAPVNIHDDSLQQALNCRKSASVVTLWITFLLLAWVCQASQRLSNFTRMLKNIPICCFFLFFFLWFLLFWLLSLRFSLQVVWFLHILCEQSSSCQRWNDTRNGQINCARHGSISQRHTPTNQTQVG